jgi:hypothetical protein
MKKKLHEAFSPEESEKIYSNFLAIVNDQKRRDRLVRLHGANAENVAYGTAVNQVKKQAANKVEEPTTEEPMDKETKLKEMIQAALSKPISEKKKPSNFTPEYDSEFDDKRKNLPDSLQKSILKKQGNLDEDLDLGHQDDEPHMLKADLYRIGKYAMELYKMVDQFDNGQEVDFPHWWQSKIVQAKSMLVAAKHYLDFELKEPQIDSMVDVAAQEDVIDEKMSKKQIKKRGEIYDALKDEGMPNEKAGKIATSKAKDIAEGVFDRIKAKFKGTTSGVGQSLKNIGAAIKGDKEAIKDPAIVSGMSKIKVKADNFKNNVEDMLNDLNKLFPEDKLEKTPEIEELVNSYKNLLNKVLRVNNTIAKGKPVNVVPNQNQPTQNQPASEPAPAPAGGKVRDEKGRFVSNKK